MHPARPLSQVTNASEVSATHETLMEYVATMVAADDAGAVADALRHTRSMLPHHFALEEDRDGIIDWIAALAPEEGDTIDRLIADHALLLAEIESVADLVERGQDATAAIAAFAEHIRAHERTESMALQAAMEEAATDGDAL